MNCKNPDILISENVRPSVVVHEECGIVIVAPAVQGQPGAPGAQGIPGPAGGSALQRSAGETLSALHFVYEIANQVFLLSPDDGEHIFQALGVTLTAADTGDLINVQRSGALDESSWSWTPGPVWLGAGGNLTQTPPSGGFDLMIGAAVSPTRIILNLQQPIDLQE